MPADPHLGRAGQVADAEQAGGLGAQDDRRVAAVAGLRKAPWARVAPRVAGRAGSAAVSEMPLVWMAGMSGLRYT
ncbi:MAG TPA: hypothetical protein VG123_27650 [Streptosporangiaceae bacterium]|nr:hypothetical protein [Streptosporangiaceae bacterium]